MRGAPAALNHVQVATRERKNLHDLVGKPVQRIAHCIRWVKSLLEEGCKLRAIAEDLDVGFAGCFDIWMVAFEKRGDWIAGRIYSVLTDLCRDALAERDVRRLSGK